MSFADCEGEILGPGFGGSFGKVGAETNLGIGIKVIAVSHGGISL